MRWFVTLCLSGLLLAAGLGSASAGAQPTEVDPTSLASPFEGMPVRDVRLEGLNRVDPQLVRNHIFTIAGEPYRAETISQDYRKLTRLNLFRRITVLAQPTADGGVIVTYGFDEWPLVADIQVSGNDEVSNQEILAAIQMRPGDPLDTFQINLARERIENLYRDRGHYLAQVDIDQQLLIDSNIVLFQVREGPRVKITDIEFLGNEAYSDRELRSNIDTKTAVFLFRVGELDEDLLLEDIRAITDYYMDRGYLDVRVDRQIDLSNDLREAKVIFLIDEGPQYTIRDVRIEGATRLLPEQLREQIDVQSGSQYGQNRVQNSVAAIRAAYELLGYYGTAVEATAYRDEDEPLVDLLFEIVEEPLSYVGEVRIIGNSLTQRRVILRELLFRPDRPLSDVDIERSRDRLLDTGLFREVNIAPQPRDPDNPLYRDVIVEVEEADTGSLNFGAAVSSDLGVFGQFSYEQRNFDLADTPESFRELLLGRAFRGAGQTFMITAQPGDEYSSFGISLSEPYLFGTDNALRTSASYTARELESYDETRAGARLTVARRLGQLWTVSAGSRVQSIDLSSIENSAPVDVFDVEDEHILTGFDIGLTRSTVDHRFRPTRGARIEFTAERVGLFGGDFDFTRLEAAHSVFMPITEDFLGRRSVLSFDTRVGHLFGGRTPIYERYFLGGRSFRGFDYRTIAPKGVRADTGELGDDPVGGDWMFFWGAQYEVPIASTFISGVAFLDTGTVIEDPGFEDYRVSAGVGLRLYIPQLGQAPLAFDFGVPILDEEGDESRIFSFSIDVPF